MINRNHLDKRFELIKKIDENRKYEPTKKELKEAYGYLDYCLSCGKKLYLFEPHEHGFEGSTHRFSCSYFTRILSWIINFLFIFLIKLPLVIIIFPFYYFYLFIKKLKGGKKING